MEEYDLSITATYANLVTSNSLYAFNALSTYILSENQDLILDLEATEVSTLGASEEEFLSWLTKSKATVISDECSSID